ncbi:MAG: hypothetical protein C4291_15510, partial [Candidatus Dadabacteria bacterium]
PAELGDEGLAGGQRNRLLVQHFQRELYDYGRDGKRRHDDAGDYQRAAYCKEEDVALFQCLRVHLLSAAAS